MRVSSAGLIVGKVATMGLGFFFWLLAAREFDAAQVGLAAGVVAAMMLCTQLALLGIGSAFITQFPSHEQRPAALLDTAFTIVGLTALAAGALFLGLASGVFVELGVVGSSVVYAALFMAMTVTGTLQILLDQVSMAMRRGDQVLSRAILFGLLTVGTLAVVAFATDSADSKAIVLPWVVGGVGLCLLGLFQLRRLLRRYRYRPRIERGLARRLVRVGVPNHLLTLTERAPGLILPIVVLEVLSREANAHWYTVWMMAWVVYIVPISVGIALFSELVHRPQSYAESIRSGGLTSIAFGAAGAVLLTVFASFALGFFGDDYADAGTSPLRILVWAFLPLTIVQVYYATCRSRQRLGEAIIAGAATGVIAVAAARIVAPNHGLTGMAVAWLATQVASGAWAIFRIRSLSRSAPDATARAAESALAGADVVPRIVPGRPAP